MLNKAVLVTALTLSFAAPLASAYSVVTTESVKGTVTAVDTSARELTIVDKSGDKALLNLRSDAVVVKDGQRSTDLSKLSPGQDIVFKKHTFTPANESLEGRIVSINHNSKIASIRRADSGNIVKVRFGENVSVKNDVESMSFADLRRGHSVVIRYSK